jgi:hypothetical protein
MENIKSTTLLYIDHSYNRTYNYYKSIAETILDLLFGASYSTGTVDWESTRLDTSKETLHLVHHLVPI